MKTTNGVQPRLKPFLFLAFFMSSLSSFAQVIVDNENINQKKEVQYMQLMFYMDPRTLKPIYFVDYGMMDTGSKPVRIPKITVDGSDIDDSMSPVMVLNKFYKAGWDYVGEAMYASLPLTDNVYTYTLKRRTDRK